MGLQNPQFLKSFVNCEKFRSYSPRFFYLFHELEKTEYPARATFKNSKISLYFVNWENFEVQIKTNTQKYQS